MNKLKLRLVITIGILILISQQVLGLLYNYFFTSDIEFAPVISFLVGLLISSTITFYLLKRKLLTKANTTMHGFVSGITAVFLGYVIFVLIFSWNAQLLPLMSWVIGSTIAGYLAGK